MSPKSARAVIRFQICSTRQICTYLFPKTSPISEKQRKDKAAIVQPLFGTDIYPECKVMLKVTL